ncbi:MAG: hypothetical protein HFI39_10450 [Lachnospiraceae bacterium]|nr:hypothetical protein [Lachnospiraceae bacterium]
MKERKIFRNLSIVVAYALYLSVIFSGKSYAGIYSGGFATGHLTYNIGGSEDITTRAASQWNGVTSKASLTYSSATDKYGSSANIITYFDVYESPVYGKLGVTYMYSTWGLSANLARKNELWVKAICYQYKTTLLNTTTKKVATATHELGHALGIDHPSDTSTDAVMQQGVKTSCSLKAYDKQNLIAKWGK